MTYRVTFLPDNVGITVEEGTSLLEAARLAGIDLVNPCGGKGTCGKCAVRIVSGEPGKGDVLSCAENVHGDVTVEIPERSRMGKHKVLLSESRISGDKFWNTHTLNPVARKYHLTIPEPTLTDNINDLDRLKKALKNNYKIEDADISTRCLRMLPETIRRGGFEITVTAVTLKKRCEIIAVEPGKAVKPAYGAAIDIGTTTVAAAILNLETGEIVDQEGSYNKQASYGADVITRIIYADENDDGLTALKSAAVDTINGLLEIMLERNGLNADDIVCMVCGGNTVMTHLFLGVAPTYLRLEPYVPAAVSFPAVKADEMGVRIYPDAPLLTIPSVASYVGGDITAGLFATVPAYAEDISLFIDVGTNGELALGNCDWLVTCSCSAGPAFEGSGVSSGMRAMKGAIDRVEIDRDSLEASYRVIDGAKPVGICGSGLICAISEMRGAGIIDRAGKIQTERKSGNVRVGQEPEYLLVSKEDGGGGDIVITESDVKNLLRAKAAIFAGIRTMLAQVQMDISDIANIYIAGGFGKFINITDAVRIGMLPDLPVEKYEYVGNSCLRGAMQGLLSLEALTEMEVLAGRMTYIELSIGNQFMEEFISALFIPHTDLSLFPGLSDSRADLKGITQ